MMRMISRCACAVLSSVMFASEAMADCFDDFADLVGWQIIYSGTVTGYYNEDGSEEDDFEGCDYGRVLIIDYNSVVTCAEYGYSYAYRPDILILGNGRSMKACIDDEMYDVRNGN